LEPLSQPGTRRTGAEGGGRVPDSVEGPSWAEACPPPPWTATRRRKTRFSGFAFKGLSHIFF
jgi:hypothetical protein